MNEINTREIAISAELLQERIENGHTGPDGGQDDSKVEADERTVDSSVVQDLKTHTGVDFEDVHRYLDVPEYPEDEPLPDWTSTFSHMVEFLDGIDDVDSTQVDIGCGVPFQEVLGWIVEYTRRHVVSDLDTTHLSDEAVEDLERHLLSQLSEVGAKALHLDFVQYVADNDPEVIENDDRSSDSTYWYDRYVSAFLDGRAAAFFEAFPVLARQMTYIVENWSEMASRFASFLNDDYHELRDLVEAEHPGVASRLELGAGDLHDGGQSVIIVEFESGDEVVYKPRSIEPVKQLYEFESWLSKKDAFPDLQTAGVVSKSDHGWVEKVESTEFSELDAVESYYRGAGALLCVLYVLNASDCQYENIIAGRESPLLVDAEAILDTPIAEVPDSRFDRKVQRRRAQSSLAGTLLLPFKVGTHARTKSGLGTNQTYRGWSRRIFWKNVNTDAMDYEYEIPEITPENNVPTYAGDPALPDQFLDELVDGFERAYDVIMNSKEDVKRRIASSFDGVPVRKVVLASALYDALSNTLTNPRYLRSGTSYGYKIQETLSRRLSTLHGAVRPDKWDDVLRAERNSLLRGDIPKFTMSTDDDGVYYEGKRVCSTDFDRTGVERVLDRIDDMSTEDKEYQRTQIEACFDDSIAKEGHW